MSFSSALVAPQGRSSVLSSTTLDTPGFRWLGLKKLTWQDPNGISREWECAFRPTRRSECDGVAVVVFLRYPVSGKEDEVVLVSQYRPPVAAEVIESPAGLMDEGEDAKATAERELLEETGFSGKVTFVSPIVVCDPGMTDAIMRFVTIEVDGDSEKNKNPVARLEEGEFITLRRLPAASMQEGLEVLIKGGFQVDARLYAMALGYTLGKSVISTTGGGWSRRWSRNPMMKYMLIASTVVVTATALVVGTLGGIRRKGMWIQRGSTKPVYKENTRC